MLPELTGALDSPFPEFSQHLMEEDLTDKMTCSIYQQVIKKTTASKSLVIFTPGRSALQD